MGLEENSVSCYWIRRVGKIVMEIFQPPKSFPGSRIGVLGRLGGGKLCSWPNFEERIAQEWINCYLRGLQPNALKR